jgi:prolyl-tRNA editing enzyme YbaK/EbsC (Cys-tRNA(Pro) deacylase)
MMQRTGADLRAFIKRHHLTADLIALPVPTPTVETAAAALGVDESQIVKSLLFWVGAEPVIVIARGQTPVARRLLAAYFGVGRKKIKLMSAEEVIQITGFPVGGVPPFGHLQQIKTLMDRGIFLENEVFAGGGAEDVLMKTSPEEIHQVTSADLLELMTNDGQQHAAGPE